MKKKKWFSAKSAYSLIVKGSPKLIDANYDPNITLVEERVVLIQARNILEAKKKSLNEAIKYAKETHENPYGQTVITKLLDYIDVYELDDDVLLSDGVEIYSDTRLLGKELTLVKIKNLIFGKIESRKEEKKRINFCNKIFFNSPRSNN